MRILRKSKGYPSENPRLGDRSDTVNRRSLQKPVASREANGFYIQSTTRNEGITFFLVFAPLKFHHYFKIVDIN